MNKLFFYVTLFMTAAASLFASDVGDLLDKAKNAYDSGDKATAIKNITEAKKIIEEENLSARKDEYIEVTRWKVVELKADEYIGKKVKAKAVLCSIGSDYLRLEVGGSFGYNSLLYMNDGESFYAYFDNSLVDNILRLKERKYFYTFYGTVIKDGSSMKLQLESID